MRHEFNFIQEVLGHHKGTVLHAKGNFKLDFQLYWNLSTILLSIIQLYWAPL